LRLEDTGLRSALAAGWERNRQKKKKKTQADCGDQQQGVLTRQWSGKALTSSDKQTRGVL
jgi:hypothetical protein